MGHYKEIFGVFALIIALISYIPYLKDVVTNKTKPHMFTWLIWGTLALIGFLGQIFGQAGPGAWPSAISTLLCFTIFLLALAKGDKNLALLDYIMLAGAFLSLFVWFFVKQPTFSIILVTITDAMGFVPTVRKSWLNPHQETMIAFILNAFKHFLTLFAIENYSLVTTLYPAYLMIANVLFVGFLLSRKKALQTELDLN